MDKLIAKLKQLFAGKNASLIFTLLGVYLLTSGASMVAFSVINKGGSQTPKDIKNARSKINLNLPKTEECPINGAKFTKAERDIWENRRPITAMIENHAESRPPSGLSKADVVYEGIAEGGISRFLGIFYCGVAAGEVKIAPVRSARIYFVNLAAEYGIKPIFMHVGGANDFSGSGDTARDVRALETLEKMGWRVPRGNDFDTTYDSGFPVFWRNYERLDHTVATEHTMMASIDEAYIQAEKRGLGAKDADGKKWDKTFTKWKFADDKAEKSATATKIAFGFWDNKPDYNVSWSYDAANNQYLRENGGKAHKDLETNTQLAAKNVVITFVAERGPVDRNMHMFYAVVGTGKALVFQNGTVIEATWSKQAPESRTKFVDAKGKEITFVRGPIWVELVRTGNTVDY